MIMAAAIARRGVSMARNRLNATLGAVGVVAWTLYLLGCGWTAWSPDGTKVLALRQGVDEVSAFAVDVRTGSTKLVASLSPRGEFRAAQWDRSGKRVLLVGGVMKRGSSVLVVPVGASAPTREVLLDYGETREPARFPPPYPQIGAELFIAGAKLQRLNLETGAIVSRPAFGRDAGAVLFQRGERIGYVAFLENEVAVGEVDRADLSLRKAYGVPWTALEPEGVSSTSALEPEGVASIALEPEAASSTEARPVAEARPTSEARPFAAVASSGDLVAFTMSGKARPDRIVVLGRSGVERILTPSLPAGHMVGNLQWSRDGRALYAAVLGPTGEKGVVQYSAALLPLGDVAASPRLIRITRLRVAAQASERDVAELWPYALQLSLSPDGRALAASTGFTFPEEREGAVVPLLDPIGGPAVHILNLENGTVRRIPLPPPEGAPANGKKGRG
jgi:hypothetical protein